jgi:putative ABC transport system substrate-binding protein
MRPLVAHCHLGLGKLYRQKGDRAKAQQHLTTATAMYREMDVGFYSAGREGGRAMKTRLASCALTLGLLAGPLAAEAQSAGKVYRIGWLHPQPLPKQWLAGFDQGLREFGYVEGKDLIIERRWGDGNFDRLPAMAADLVRLNVDVLISGNSRALRELQKATRTIPIVMLGSGDPLGAGLVASLARPGGNLTGLSQLAPELSGKRLELLKEVVPRLSRLTMLSNPGNPSVVIGLQETRAAAAILGLILQSLDVRKPDELDSALATIARDRPDALVLPIDSMIYEQRTRIAEFAVKQGLPSMGPYREFVEVGGLMAYGASIPDIFRRSVGYIDKILKGAKPADLPVEQPTKYEFIINLKTAKLLGLTIPPAVLARADEVIQ